MEYWSEVVKMGDKKPLKLKIKKKDSSTTTATPKAQVPATEHIPQTGGIKLVLKNAKIHIDQIIIRKK